MSHSAVEWGFKNLVFLGFYKKNPKNLKSPNVGCFRFFLENLKNPEFRLKVTVENCCLSKSNYML